MAVSQRILSAAVVAVALVLVTALPLGASVLPDATALEPQPPSVAAPAAAATVTPPEPLLAVGDFRGAGRAQIAVLSDPNGDFAMRISVLDRPTTGDTFTEALWYTSLPGSFDLTRMKVAVADVNYDGRADLVVLYDDRATSVRLLVFLSNGDSFAYSGNSGWWKSDAYAWSRVHDVSAGDFSGFGQVGLLLTYQYDNFRMRIHYFAASGGRFLYNGDQGVFDGERSGLGGYDLSRAQFAVGRFTRSGGAQQLSAVYQYPNFRIRTHVFEPTPQGLVALNGYTGIYDSGVGQYDTARAKFVATDAQGDGRSDLVALYGYPDGSARLHVFSGAAGFQPSGGFAGWTTFPASALAFASTQLVAGDFNGDGFGDAATVAPSGNSVRAQLLRSVASIFCTAADVVTKPACTDRWPLSGQVVAAGVATRRPLYVKIDNAPPARPHYGIGVADMVFEWLVEGYTTRLAAIFHSQDPDVLGSIRSARHTERSIVPAFRGVLVYSGAAPEETQGIAYDASVGRYIDLNAGYFGWPYRVGFRVIPYNMFTTGARVRESAQTVGGGDPVTVRPWAFLPLAYRDPQAGGFALSVPARVLGIPYTPAAFPVRYEYDDATRTYGRWQASAREIDAAGNVPVAARNVVVVLTDVAPTDRYGLDAAGSPKIDMRLVGEGVAVIFRDGLRQEGTWSRVDISDPYAFRNRAGETILLAPGQTWVHVVPADWTIPSR